MKLKFALLLTILAIGIHTYLTLHYFDLNYGQGAADSVCNLSATLNCDAVAASKYATLFRIPLALWGAAANLMLFFLLLGWVLGWTDDSARLGRYTFWYSLMIAGASVVMAVISLTSMSVYCVFCIAAYIVSFLTAYLIWSEQDPDARPAKEYAKELFTSSARFFLVYLLGVPFLAFIANNSFASKAGPQSMERFVKQSVTTYRASTPVTFNEAPVLVKGASEADAKVTIVEFADFMCIHCKNAVNTIKAFLSTRPEVQLRFHFYPLDSACNDNVNGTAGGMSCLLAKAVACAEENGQKGWPMHDKVFAAQQEFAGLTVEAAKSKVSAFAEELDAPVEPFKTCLESADLHNRIKKMAAEGFQAGLKGTPTFFLNGRRVEGGQLLPVLEAVYNEAINQALKK